MSGPDPRHPVDSLLAAAAQAWHENRREDAVRAYQEVLRLSPEDPRALNALGNRVLAAGDAESACALLRRATAANPGAAPIWLNLSFALRAAGDAANERAALEKALEIDPYFVLALLHKAQWLERHGREAEAVRAYRNLLDAAPALDAVSPAIRPMLEHGHALVQKADQDIDATIRAALGSRSTVSQRLEHCLDILAGRRSIYVHKPAGLHFPYLPAIQFFDRALFPWLESFEAQSSVILEELLRLIREGVTGGPYVRVAAGEPVNQWRDLNNSVDWSAVFLWKDGNRVDEIARRCPATMAALAKVSMLDIAGRGPTAMFSLLRPGTHIPPHHGVTNTRAVVHLPLIVPAGCRFRVGSETRAWPSGEAWIFDDTIEHEAWNDGTEMRAVLIFDVWNPYLDEAEKDALRVVDTVLQRFGKSDAGGSGI